MTSCYHGIGWDIQSTDAMRTFALSLFVASAFTCQALFPAATPSPGPDSTRGLDASVKHFESDLLSFDYPSGYRLHSPDDPAFRWFPDIDLGGDLLLGLGDPLYYGHGYYLRSIRILRYPRLESADLTAMMEAAYAQPNAAHPWLPMEGAVAANGPITVDGRLGMQKSYRLDSSELVFELRDVWIPAERSVYVVSFILQGWMPREATAFGAMADDLLASLKINETAE